jgi:L-lactate dehydrogenase complex protein LldF
MSTPSIKPVDHPANAKKFIANTERVAWHDESLWFVRYKRDNAVKMIPEWEQLRDYASQIKMHMLSKVDEYLIQFEENAKKNGIQVHFAADGDEHNRIVHGILEKHKVKKLVKSKSMLTEECHLNPYLIERGIEVVDTDLGERIVQFREEPPSHLVMPAIHIKKAEIGELFHEKLGTKKGADDPKYLAEAARTHLREKFLAAEAGLTGVNFAIAETGGIVVCTNEGNADLGTSLPPVHIASMGMEKLLPKLEHLGVFTRLLGRSATGQPITTYTSHFHGPKPGGEMHIVIVNNGRTGILQKPEFRRSLCCIRCAACINTCPIYRRSGGHSYGSVVPGPIGSVINPAQDLKKFATLPFASTLCGSCTDVCPVKIDLHDQLLAWRKVVAAEGHLPKSKMLAMKVAGKVLASPTMLKYGGKAGKLMKIMPRFMLFPPNTASATNSRSGTRKDQHHEPRKYFSRNSVRATCPCRITRNRKFRHYLRRQNCSVFDHARIGRWHSCGSRIHRGSQHPFAGAVFRPGKAAILLPRH